ncbi:hypothetical protein P154DRAFT_520807 [Amniculicola lignicola CBS 123094]|uniref:PHD-type domain-containing protein n=1 Tax=Amniculicola lignicola CBS 123094 TaxID=1392246 RepID=A0A6A5WYR3_9PLEO|nr:hypothetical protein P154DRAFT_520807 [Amniculicola lignicola CBS 123094]
MAPAARNSLGPTSSHQRDRENVSKRRGIGLSREAINPNLTTLSDWQTHQPKQKEPRDSERLAQRPSVAANNSSLFRQQSGMSKASSFNGSRERVWSASATSRSFDGHMESRKCAKARLPPDISPPATKRARLNSTSITDTALIGVPTKFPRVGTSGGISKAQPVPSIFGRVSGGTRTFERPLSRRDDDEMSTSSGPPRSDFSGTSQNSSKVCHSCRKATREGHFDPLIKCYTCSRHFHSGHRDPKLAQGADPKQWSCYRCVVKLEKLTASFQKQPSRDSILGPSSAANRNQDPERTTHLPMFPNVPIRLQHSPQPPKEANAILVDDDILTAHPGSYNRIVQGPKDELSSSLTKELRRTEIPNTPTQSSSQIPKDTPIMRPVHPSGDDSHSSLFFDSPLPLDNRSVSPSKHSGNVRCPKCHSKRQGRDNKCGCHKKHQGNDASMVSISIPETPDAPIVSQKDADSTRSNIPLSSPARRTGAPPLDARNILLSPQNLEKSLHIDNADQSSMSEPGKRDSFGIGSRPVTALGPISFSIDSEEALNESANKTRRNLAIHSNKSERQISTEDVDAMDIVDDNPCGTTGLRLQASANGVLASDAQPKSPQVQLKNGHRNYSNREMIGLALAASGTSTLTVAEMTIWIASHFSEKAKNQIALQRSVSATASATRDFLGGRVDGERVYTYKFANGRLKEQYKKLYEDFTRRATSATGSGPQQALNAVEDRLSNLALRAPSSETRHVNALPNLAKMLEGSLSIPQLPESTITHIKEAIHTLEPQNGQPAEQALSKPRKLWFDLSPEEMEKGEDPEPIEEGPEVDLSKFKIVQGFPGFLLSPTKAMSKEDIEAKKEEIRKRPTRKQIFRKPPAWTMVNRKDAPVSRPARQSLRHPIGRKKSVEKCGSIVDEDGQRVVVEMVYESSDES